MELGNLDIPTLIRETSSFREMEPTVCKYMEKETYF